MKYVPAGLIAFVVDQVVEARRALDGRIYNPATGLWEPSTPASEAAVDAAINATVGAALDAVPFPIALGALGAVDRSQADAMVAKIVAAMKAYVAATTKMN